MSYYNTTKQTGKELNAYREKARTQNEIVKGIISNFKKPFSVKDVYRKYPVMNTPITSIRRSINTLKNDDYIEETGELVKGLFNRKERQLKLCS